MGARIEHRQSDMDAQQYKQYAGHPSLPPTSYKLSAHTAAGRGVFSFCVCPGGQVVAAARRLLLPRHDPPSSRFRSHASNWSVPMSAATWAAISSRASASNLMRR